MKNVENNMNLNWLAVVATLAFLAVPLTASAHCQVPCGIYNDEARVESLREDARTIAKAVSQVHELAGKTDAQSLNQITRWVMNKEEHASHIIDVVANYFLAQRVKPGDDVDSYTASLVDHHSVIVAAMKTKQNASQETVDALFRAIETLGEHYHSH